MESIVSSSVVFFAIVAFFIIEKLMYRNPLSEERIKEYQETLNELSVIAKEQYKVDLKQDAFTELMKEREVIKSLLFIFSGFLSGEVLIGLVMFYCPGYSDINLIAFMAAMLISYGSVRSTKSKRSALAVLIIVMLFVTFFASILDHWIECDYYWLLVIIVVSSLWIAFSKKK